MIPLVKKVEMVGFMGYTDAVELALPERGLTVLTGPNGAGKSSLVEAVSVALWGKTLRGKLPWRSGTKGSTSLELHDGTVVTRGRKGTRNLFDIAGPGLGKGYETATKGHGALEHMVGPWDTWRRTHVFSSHDAAHLSMATDAQRKEMLEQLLGLDRFGPALEACRAELKRAQARAREGRRACAELDAAIASHERVLSDTVLPDVPECDAAALEQAKEKARVLRASAADAESRARELDRGGGAREAELRTIDRQLAKLAIDVCSACGQKIPIATRRDEMARLEAERTEIQRAAKDAKTATAKAEALLRSTRAAVDAAWSEVAELTAVLRAATEAKNSRERAQRVREKAEQELAGLRERMEDAELSADVADSAAAELEATERVLGLRGVRAHVMRGAIHGLMEMANGWLERIAGPGVSVEVREDSEALIIDVHGYADGVGYRAASGGQRRRLDVALLLAMSELAASLGGRPRGTLFFDEVFDALDQDGVNAVSDVVSDLASEAAVVVISHNQTLLRSLRPDVHYHVEDGKVISR